MPFQFDSALSNTLPSELHLIDDRRDNPVSGRQTLFRLLQGNMLSYTFPDFVPGFAPPGINHLPFPELLSRPIENAEQFGRQLYGQQLKLSSNQVAKVAGDIFKGVEAAILWNAAARWNRYMRGTKWDDSPRYPAPPVAPSPERQIAAVSLKRKFDWVKLLKDADFKVIDDLRKTLKRQRMEFPTSTPDILVTVLPESCRNSELFITNLPDIRTESQAIIDNAFRPLEGEVGAGEILLAIALKKSLRSDRLYQPLYEANVMQLLLERKLGAPRIEFEVHTLDSAGTAAEDTYRAASMAAVADPEIKAPHRAVRELYEPIDAAALVNHFYEFLSDCAF